MRDRFSLGLLAGDGQESQLDRIERKIDKILEMIEP